MILPQVVASTCLATRDRVVGYIETIVLHALVPRYEWRSIKGVPMLRVDRWTGATRVFDQRAE